jgi:hypothetical protein
MCRSWSSCEESSPAALPRRRTGLHRRSSLQCWLRGFAGERRGHHDWSTTMAGDRLGAADLEHLPEGKSCPPLHLPCSRLTHHALEHFLYKMTRSPGASAESSSMQAWVGLLPISRCPACESQGRRLIDYLHGMSLATGRTTPELSAPDCGIFHFLVLIPHSVHCTISDQCLEMQWVMTRSAVCQLPRNPRHRAALRRLPAVRRAQHLRPQPGRCHLPRPEYHL